MPPPLSQPELDKNMIPTIPILPTIPFASVLPDLETSPPVTSISTPPDTESATGTLDPDLERVISAPSNYYSLSLWRKAFIVFTTSFTTLSVTFASTSLFQLTDEIAESFGTTPTIIQVINALVLFTMGLSGFVWGPIGRLFGRKNAWLAMCVVFLLCTVGTGLAPEDKGRVGLRVFIAMRVLSGLEGTSFHIFGQTWLADCFEPTQRGTATGFFLLGTVIGPAFGPCVSGIMVTFVSWRGVLWLEAAMTVLGLVLSAVFLPDIRRPHEMAQLQGNASSRALGILKAFNPSRVFKLLVLPNVLLTDIVCGLLSWNQYTLLAAVRHLLNPRFHLTTTLVSGLFYIAPGVGFVIGTVVGGSFSDVTVKKWILTRGGLRLPQDRLNSGMTSFFCTIPVATLIYGWGLQCDVGGLALPIVTAFFTAIGIFVAFASINTYCAEVLPKQRTEVIASKYLFQYTFSATGSAVMVPLIDAIGIGPATTIGVAFCLTGGAFTLMTAKYGLRMQGWVEMRLAPVKGEKPDSEI